MQTSILATITRLLTAYQAACSSNTSTTAAAPLLSTTSLTMWAKQVQIDQIYSWLRSRSAQLPILAASTPSSPTRPRATAHRLARQSRCHCNRQSPPIRHLITRHLVKKASTRRVSVQKDVIQMFLSSALGMHSIKSDMGRQYRSMFDVVSRQCGSGELLLYNSRLSTASRRRPVYGRHGVPAFSTFYVLRSVKQPAISAVRWASEGLATRWYHNHS